MSIKVKDASGKVAKVAGRGLPGPAGKSAYQYAVDGGYTGTEEEFQALLGSGPWVAEAGYVPASNPNLLDNWYFPDPINQRGGAVYAGTAYGIDRWYGRSPYTQVSLDSDGVTITTIPNDSNANSRSIIQVVENVENLKEKILTASLLIEKSTNVGSVEILKNAIGSVNRLGIVFFQETDIPTLVSVNFTVPANIDKLLFQVGVNGPHTVNPLAAKLELGEKQTLAHQDADGYWVLNDPPPNKALELLKCQRYRIQFVNPVNPNETSYGMVGFGSAVSATRCSIMIPTPCPINRSGTIVYTGNFRLFSGENKLWANGIAVTNIISDYCPSNGVCLWVDVDSGLTAGKPYYLAYVPTGNGTKNSLIYDMNL